MAFLRVEKKQSGSYLRIIESYREDGKTKQRTLYSMGKAEDYSPDQLESIAQKLMDLAGRDLSKLVSSGLQEQGRYNYGYAQIIHRLWSIFKLAPLINRIKKNSRVSFDFTVILQLMIVERINAPCSKLQTFHHQSEYLGITQQNIPLHHLYRSLDLLCKHEERIKSYIFSQKRSLFSDVLDVVFYDVTTLYFDSQKEKEDALRQKGYSKDGKAHKTQIVLGLLVDKARNPITYQVYQGNTYEGKTMIDALKQMQKKYTIDKVVVVADTAMIDKANRDYLVDKEIDYIIGDSIKKLGKKITVQLLDKAKHQCLPNGDKEVFSYTEQDYNGRRIICTWSAKRARKDKHQRQLLIDKAQKWLDNPNHYKQVTKRGAGRFIETSEEGTAIQLNKEKIKADAQYDGFKAIATTSKLPVEQILEKYSDLYEVEHAFRTLKSQLEIRPMFHWTDTRIKGHVCMCFIAYTFINHLRNKTKMQYNDIVRALDKMQLSDMMDTSTNKRFYLRARISQNQARIIKMMGLKMLNDTMSQSAVNQLIMS